MSLKIEITDNTIAINSIEISYPILLLMKWRSSGILKHVIMPVKKNSTTKIFDI